MQAAARAALEGPRSTTKSPEFPPRLGRSRLAPDVPLPMDSGGLFAQISQPAQRSDDVICDRRTHAYHDANCLRAVTWHRMYEQESVCAHRIRAEDDGDEYHPRALIDTPSGTARRHGAMGSAASDTPPPISPRATYPDHAHDR